MANEINSATLPSQMLFKYWRGLGAWNIYFILKFALLWYGYLNFHPLENLVFMAFLLLPLPIGKMNTLRQWIAIVVGFSLFWYDTWLPGINSIKSEASQLVGFDMLYLLDLVNRFINWQMIGVGFVLIVGYFFIAQWIRVTLFVVLAMVWLNVLTIAGPAISLIPATGTTNSNTATDSSSTSANTAMNDLASLPPTSENLSAYLNQFYQAQKELVTQFPSSLPEDSAPFDILIINICSLAWSDLESVQMESHPFWQKFDIMFDNFNSATSYSGPGSLRLLRASCGQSSHKGLYSPVQQQCYLFDNLAKLGFTNQLIMDHSGVYGGYLDELRKNGNMQAPLQSQEGIAPELTAFDGSPIYDDAKVLQRWLDNLAQDSRSATFFNIIPLHDGDRFVGQSKTAPYKDRAKMVLDKLDAFMDNLEKSGRKVLVIVVPEHGAALVGDKMQISGLRDIPSPSITHIPVGVKLINIKGTKPTTQIHVKEPSSYLAVSEIIARLVDGKNFVQDNIDWDGLVKNLPQTPMISENSNAIVMQYQDKYYVQLDGGKWVPYPAK